MAKSIDIDRLPSEYHAIGERNVARCRFLTAIQQVQPQVLSDLRERVLPRFREVINAPDYRRSRRGNRGVGRKMWWDYDEVEEVIRSIQSEVNAWADSFHLGPDAVVPVEHGWREELGIVEWMRPILCETLEAWVDLKNPGPASALEWRILDGRTLLEVSHEIETNDFELTLRGWCPMTEHKRAFLARSRAQFDAALRDHVERAEAKMAGFDTAIEKARPVPPFHTFLWLASYQVCEMSYSAIAKHANTPGSKALTRQGITKGVHVAAEAVVGPRFREWLREESKGGRPTGQ